MAGTGSVEDAVGEAAGNQRPCRGEAAAMGEASDGLRQAAVKEALLIEHPQHRPVGDGQFRGRLRPSIACDRGKQTCQRAHGKPADRHKPMASARRTHLH